jgi:hypothetical protein
VRRQVVVAPARHVRIGWPEEDSFIPVGKYYRDGCFQQPDIFVAEVPGARLHVGSGLVCTPGFKALADSGRLDRLEDFGAFGRPKPRELTKLAGNHSTIQYCYADNCWHWMVDCLPKLISLEKALAGRELILLMPETITPFQRDSMHCLLPENISVSYFPCETWVESESFLWASLASGRCNAFLPPGYFAEMRARIFARYGLSGRPPPRRRLYITRRNAGHRRVKNEAAVLQLLKEFSFEEIELERLSFREQVQLFQEAAVVAGAHGAGLVSTVFSGPMTLIVFYATQKPPNYFHTQTRALGQRHLFLRHDGKDEDADFSVSLNGLRLLLKTEISSSFGTRIA